MLSTPKSKGELFLASSLRDGLEDNDIRQVKTLLLSNEADPNVLIPTHGISPFHLVIGNDSEKFAEEVTKLFLRHGGNPNVRSYDGMTPVHVAAAWGRIGVLELLLANGGDSLCLDDDGRSPFHYAFDGNFYNAVTVLGKYCGMSQDEEAEDEPKYKLTLDKILINKGNVVAEYVTSEDSCSVSTKSEWNERFDDVESETKSKTKRQENRSPSALPAVDKFSHLNSNNITLRRYHKRSAVPSPATNLDRAFEGSNVAAERLLIGEIISQLSDTYANDSLIVKDPIAASGNHAINDATKNTSEIKKMRSFLPPLTYRSDKAIARQKPFGVHVDTSTVRKSTNLRKTCNTKTPTPSKQKIITTGSSSKWKHWNGDNATPPSHSTRPEAKKKTVNSTPRYRCKTAKSVETLPRRLVDTSIISKSPNLRLTGDSKIPTPSRRKIIVSPTSTIKSKYWNGGNATPPLRSTRPEARVKSATSTPKRKLNGSRLYTIPKITRKAERPMGVTSRKVEKVTPTALDRTYSKDRFGVVTYSPDSEIHAEGVQRRERRFLAKSVAVNLDDRMYDDNQDSFSDSTVEGSSSNDATLRLKPPRIYNDIKTETTSEGEQKKLCNAVLSTFKATSPYEPLGKEKVNNVPASRPLTPKFQGVEFSPKSKTNFCTEAAERLAAVVNSPGSSRAISVSTIIGMRHCDDKEETQRWLEIEEACRSRCVTPPASVSMIVADDSPSPSRTSQTTFYSDYGSEDSYGSDFNEESVHCSIVPPNTRMMNSISRSESFVSVEEEYTYEDAEEGVVFVERRLCVIPPSARDDWNPVKKESSLIDRFDDLLIAPSDRTSVSSQSESLSRSMLDDEILRARLTALGEQPGPITKTTYDVYLKRLWRLERERKKTTGKKVDLNETRKQIDRVVSNAIPEFLLATDWTTNLQFYQSLEQQAFKEYATANPTRKYRGGISKTSFCYLLLDPRVTRDLPRNSSQLSVEDRWKRFLESVFYVGQGKAARPAHHLYDAFGVWSKRKRVDNINRKIRRILDIWEEGRGIVCLHVFYHTMVEEACSREASMIDALDTTHLTNCNRGTYYGYATTMSSQEKRSLGKYLLYKAMEIFMHEGERQLFPRNITM